MLRKLILEVAILLSEPEIHKAMYKNWNNVYSSNNWKIALHVNKKYFFCFNLT